MSARERERERERERAALGFVKALFCDIKEREKRRERGVTHI